MLLADITRDWCNLHIFLFMHCQFHTFHLENIFLFIPDPCSPLPFYNRARVKHDFRRGVPASRSGRDGQHAVHSHDAGHQAVDVPRDGRGHSQPLPTASLPRRQSPSQLFLRADDQHAQPASGDAPTARHVHLRRRFAPRAAQWRRLRTPANVGNSTL